MSKIRKAAATLMLMSSVNTVCLGDALRGLGDTLRGLCSGDRRLVAEVREMREEMRAEMARMQRELEEFKFARMQTDLDVLGTRFNLERMQEAVNELERMQEDVNKAKAESDRVRAAAMQGMQPPREMRTAERQTGLDYTSATVLCGHVIVKIDTYSEYVIVTASGRNSSQSTMFPSTFYIEGPSKDEEFRVLKEFLYFSCDNQGYRTTITVKNCPEANKNTPLQIFAEVQTRTGVDGEKNTYTFLVYDDEKKQWVSDISGGHDPIYDAITEGFTVELVDPNNVKWTASAKNGFIFRRS